MKTPRSERKNKIEMIRREKKTVLNKVYHLGFNGANIYMVVEFNGKYIIFDSSPDKKWRPSDEALVSVVSNRHPVYVDFADEE